MSELQQIAKTSSSSEELMRILIQAQKPDTINDSTCRDWYVKADAAQNMNASEAVLLWLLDNGNSDILYLVVENPTASAAVIEKAYEKYLAMDFFNRCYARLGFAIADAPRTSKEVLEKMAALSKTAMSQAAAKRLAG